MQNFFVTGMTSLFATNHMATGDMQRLGCSALFNIALDHLQTIIVFREEVELAIRKRKNAGQGANWFTWKDRFIRNMDGTPIGTGSSAVHRCVKLPCLSVIMRADRWSVALLDTQATRFALWGRERMTAWERL